MHIHIHIYEHVNLLQDQAIKEKFKYPYLKNEVEVEDRYVDYLNTHQPMELYSIVFYGYAKEDSGTAIRIVMRNLMRREMETYPQRVDAATSTLRILFQDPGLDGEKVHQLTM